MTSNHSKGVDIVQYGQRITFLPPNQNSSSLKLMAAHLIPRELLPEAHLLKVLEFPLRPLISSCKKKLRITERSEKKKNERKRWLPNLCDLAEMQDHEEKVKEGAESGKRVKLDQKNVRSPIL